MKLIIDTILTLVQKGNMSDDVRVDKKAEIRSSDFSEWKNQPRHFVRDRFIRLEKRAETRYFEQSIHRDKPGKF